jgi:hypothetical protein
MTDPCQPQQQGQGVQRPAGGRASPVPRRLLTIVELSAATTLSVSTLRRLYTRGLIVGYQPGGPRTRVVFPPDSIEQAVKAMLTASATAPEPTPETATAPRRGPRPKWLGNS